jgi:chromate reductase
MLSGSVRKDSLNSRLLRAVPALAPPVLKWEQFEGLGELPMYDQDLDHEEPPEPVVRLRSAVAAADGLVIATPEYNHSIPGVLKNAIDWASRPKASAALVGKSIAVFVATPSRANGFRAIADTTRVLNNLGNIVVPGPEVVVHGAYSVLQVTAGDRVKITDPRTCALIQVQLNVLAELLTNDVAGLMHRAIQRYSQQYVPIGA